MHAEDTHYFNKFSNQTSSVSWKFEVIRMTSMAAKAGIQEGVSYLKRAWLLCSEPIFVLKVRFLSKYYKFKGSYHQIYQCFVKNQDIFEELVQIAWRLDQKKDLENFSLLM